jgi:hypothetical protein
MEVEAKFKKQVSYPQIFSRLLSAMLDMTILTFLTSPLMEYVSLRLFKANFGEYAKLNNLSLEGRNDMESIIRSQGFMDQTAIEQYVYFFGEYMIFQYLLFSIYFIFMWTKFGTSVGKFLFKINVVDYRTLSKPTLISSVLRYIGYTTAPIGIIVALFNEERRTIHDMVSNTMVIKS